VGSTVGQFTIAWRWVAAWRGATAWKGRRWCSARLREEERCHPRVVGGSAGPLGQCKPTGRLGQKARKELFQI
jgi:hypothetical protein